MNCKIFGRQLPDLVLDPGTFSANAREHVSVCEACHQEYASLVATCAAMDAWGAPEPSIYFDQKMAVLLREEQSAPRLSFFARMREHLLFNTGRQFRPTVAGVLALVIMLGGGSYAGVEGLGHRGTTPHISAAVNDLQSLDKNEPALQQMDQLLQDDDSSPADMNTNAPS